MSIFQFGDYKAFVNEWIAKQPRRGRGVFQKFAMELKVHPTLVSHIFKGSKDLTLEQAVKIHQYLRLPSLDGDYFLLLVQRARSGSEDLKRILDRQINELKSRAMELGNRVRHEGALSEEAKRIFYSNWHYSAIRLASSLDRLRTSAEISRYLSLTVSTVDEVLQFLAENGLVNFENDRFYLGPSVTHLDSKSEMLPTHHINWRRKAIERYHFLKPRELVFSAPLAISKENADQFREKLVALIQELGECARQSQAEELRCFNVDWVEIGNGK